MIVHVGAEDNVLDLDSPSGSRWLELGRTTGHSAVRVKSFVPEVVLCFLPLIRPEMYMNAGSHTTHDSL